MARTMTKRKKQPKTFSRRARTGFAAAPTDSFHNFLTYIRLEVDKKDVSARIKTFIKKTYTKEDYAMMMNAPEWAFASCYGAAASLAWADMNLPFPDKWNPSTSVDIALTNIRDWALKRLAEKEDSDKPKTAPSRSPMDIVRERTSEFIGEVESVLDMYNSDTYMDWENYSVYNELQKIDAAYNIAKGVADYYAPLRDEFKELVEKKTPDLVEGYSHLTVKQRKEFLSIVEAIIADAERYMASKKAVRKVRKPRVKSAEKQVEKVQYLKDSAEFKVTSISPNQIIGARRVYVFNTKQRLLTELVCRLPNGFEVSGTTIKGLDEEASRTVRLRKPLDFLPIVLGKTPNQIDKEWKQLTTKNQATNGRINKDTIILRAMDK